MKKTALQNVLQALDFQEKEALIYMTCLELGPSLAGRLAKKTGINRSTVYYYLDQLKNRGLMKSSVVNEQWLFVAESPQVLVDELDRKQIQMEKNKLLLEDSMPLFTQLVGSSPSENEVFSFSGKNAVKRAYESLDWSEFQFGGMFSPGKYDEVFSEEDLWGTHDPKVFLNQRCRVLVTDTKGSDRYEAFATRSKVDFQVKRFGDQELHTDTVIMNDVVFAAQLDSTNPSAVLIKSPVLVESYKQMFENIWSATV